MVDLWRDFWIRETGTGQQVAELRDRLMMMMMIIPNASDQFLRISRQLYLSGLISLTAVYPTRWSRDSSVGIVTRYGLHGPGIKSRCVGRDFPHLSRPALGPTQPPTQWAPGLFPGGKATVAWSWPSTQSSAEVKGRVQLYLSSNSGPLWSVVGWALPLPYVPRLTWYHKEQSRCHQLAG